MQTTLEAFGKAVKKDTKRNLLAVFSEDPYDVKTACSVIKKRFSTSLEVNEYIAKEGWSKIKHSLDSFSFLATETLVVIEEIEKGSKDLYNSLIKYFENPNPSFFVLLIGKRAPNALSQLIENKGVALQVPKVKPWELRDKMHAWISQASKQKGKSISAGAVESLMDAVGFDKNLLLIELDKLITFCSEEKEVSQKAVELLTPRSEGQNQWSFGEKVLKRQSGKAFEQLEQMLADGLAPPLILRQLRHQMRQAFMLCSMRKIGLGEKQIQEEFPYLKGKQLQNQLFLSQKYGEERLKKALLSIDGAEVQFKNVTIDHSLLLENLLGEICI